MGKYTFANPPKYRGAARTLGALLFLSVLLNVYLLFLRGRFGGDGDEGDTEGADNAMSGEEGATAADADAAADEGPITDPGVRAIGDFEALTGLDLIVEGSLSRTLDGVIEGRRSSWVTATVGRVLMWKVDLGSDLRRGDRLRVLYEPQGEEEVRIGALHFDTQKMGREYRAYHFRTEGDSWGSFWDETGAEVPARLKQSPIEDYHEITALLGDGRNHKGVDFRADVGTPVFSVKPGKVLRTTWNFRYNGNSLEIRYDDGTIARYLHLEAVDDGIESGTKVAAGQRVATSGNTGRTSAPHLHYELEQAGRIIDPLEYHGITHRQLDGEELSRFLAMVDEYDAALDEFTAAQKARHRAEAAAARAAEAAAAESDDEAPPAADEPTDGAS